MKKDLLQWLVCPDCRGNLQLEEENSEGAEVREGKLRCTKCVAVFPIARGIPRFVSSEAYANSFGFEWNKFRDVQIDILNRTNESEKTFMEKTGLTPEDVRGKFVLDAGCGAGRYAEVVSRWGCKAVIGCDLSLGVDAAYQNIGSRSNVHLVQADLFKLPLRGEAFNIVFSIGVLHHTSNTHEAFKAIVPYLEKGGIMAVYVYQAWKAFRPSDTVRKLTVRLPKPLLYYLSLLSIPLYYLYKIPLIGRFWHILLPISMHPRPRWRWLDTFDWYSPKFQWKHTYPEVFQWFKEAGLSDIELLETSPICIRGVKS